MKKHLRLLLIPIALYGFAFTTGPINKTSTPATNGSDSLLYPEEKHFSNIRQLTSGGDNAEAYWSFDSRHLIFQSNNKQWGLQCDQIFLIKDETPAPADIAPSMLSSGKGRTTCAYFLPGNKSVLFATTEAGGAACPPEPQRRADGKYLWPIYPSFDIVVTNLKGKVQKKLTNHPGYDAEATVSPDGKKIVFTSDRSGDLELWTMDINGKNLRQVTKGLGYDGGAFFSPDSKRLVFRASRPTSDSEISEYKALLKEGLVAPTSMEIYTCNLDGSKLKQVTRLGKANWAPFFHPSGKKIIFSSNHKSKRGFQFNLFMINEDGTGLEQISYDKVFDAFPMFSPNGKKLVFSSNRNNKGTRDTNIFAVDWKD
jgi:Tol biopolymer transport system component